MGKTLLITGGTGSFGNAVAKQFLKAKKYSEIRIFSRDESKQEKMRFKFKDSKFSFYLGDVRDLDRIKKVCGGVTHIFHAAALKQVPSCEFSVWETIKTNVMGSKNVIDAAISNDVQNLTMLSTDKSVYPINAMGMTKALMEKLAMSANFPKNTKINCVRYGNVMHTRGSVIPLFVEQILNKKDITLTNPKMTRFMMKIDESIKLVEQSINSKKSNEIFVKKSPATDMYSLASALKEIFNSKSKILTTGIRPGEKIYETLINSEEMNRTISAPGYFVIKKSNNNSQKKLLKEYNSNNTKKLIMKDLTTLLKSLPEIKKLL